MGQGTRRPETGKRRPEAGKKEERWKTLKPCNPVTL